MTELEGKGRLLRSGVLVAPCDDYLGELAEGKVWKGSIMLRAPNWVPCWPATGYELELEDGATRLGCQLDKGPEAAPPGASLRYVVTCWTEWSNGFSDKRMSTSGG